jgi:hypothetical protein
MPRRTHAVDLREPLRPLDALTDRLDRLARAGRLTPPRTAREALAPAPPADVERTPSGLLVARMRPVRAVESRA